jgi:outer membrane receptor protein involved in Fe transport
MAFPTNITGQQGFGNTGDGIATWLVGTPGFARITTQNFISSYRDSYSFYGQDDWKVSSKLTINIGLRYEVTSPIGEKFGRQAHLDIWGIEHSSPLWSSPRAKTRTRPWRQTSRRLSRESRSSGAWLRPI